MVYELRYYELKLGTLPRYLAAIEKAVPTIRQHANLLGFWTPQSGDLTMVYHLWVYSDFARRDEQMKAYRAEPVVQEFLKVALECVERTHNVFLNAAPFMADLPLGLPDFSQVQPLP